MNTATENKKLTITLTDRPPVKINENDWPVRASASWKDWDNTYECQANRTWSAWIKVRQHIDGRTLVYGGYSYTTQFQGESDASYRGGQMLTPNETQYPIAQRNEDHDWAGPEVIAAIREVGERLLERSDCEHFSDLIAECIADLPAEEI